MVWGREYVSMYKRRLKFSSNKPMQDNSLLVSLLITQTRSVWVWFVCWSPKDFFIFEEIIRESEIAMAVVREELVISSQESKSKYVRDTWVSKKTIKRLISTFCIDFHYKTWLTDENRGNFFSYGMTDAPAHLWVLVGGIYEFVT